MKVLVVDDSAVIRRLAALAFQGTPGWQVVTAGSGTEAVRLAATEDPAVILLDLHMPDLGGPATLAELRSNPATSATPVIFVTAEESPAVVRELTRLGAIGVIPKPFVIERLAGQVSHLLRPAA